MSDILVDLHCHSLRSDGQLSPADLVDRAAEMGVNVLALTDHDTINGVAEARAQAVQHDMKIINGIEFSSVWNGVGIHIVGLGFDETHPVMVAALERQENARLERAKTIAQRLEKQGVKGIWEKAESIANGAQIGRPHFAQALIELEKVNNMAQAFKRYLGAGKPGDVKTMWPEMSEVVQWITDSGGTAVIAHPDKYKLTRTKLMYLFKAFKNAGGQAIEVTTGGMDHSFCGYLATLCDEFDFLASQGSDFHGPKPWSELGKFPPMPSSAKPVWQQWV